MKIIIYNNIFFWLRGKRIFMGIEIKEGEKCMNKIIRESKVEKVNFVRVRVGILFVVEGFEGFTEYEKE